MGSTDEDAKRVDDNEKSKDLGLWLLVFCGERRTEVKAEVEVG
jgi:hypothetical protein